MSCIDCRLYLSLLVCPDLRACRAADKTTINLHVVFICSTFSLSRSACLLFVFCFSFRVLVFLRLLMDSLYAPPPPFLFVFCPQQLPPLSLPLFSSFILCSSSTPLPFCCPFLFLAFSFIRYGHLEDVYDLCWSPNGAHVFTASIDMSCCVAVWDLDKGDHRRKKKKSRRKAAHLHVHTL